jgi:hypothetical protein
MSDKIVKLIVTFTNRERRAIVRELFEENETPVKSLTDFYSEFDAQPALYLEYQEADKEPVINKLLFHAQFINLASTYRQFDPHIDDLAHKDGQREWPQ